MDNKHTRDKHKKVLRHNTRFTQVHALTVYDYETSIIHKDMTFFSATAILFALCVSYAAI